MCIFALLCVYVFACSVVASDEFHALVSLRTKKRICSFAFASGVCLYVCMCVYVCLCVCTPRCNVIYFMFVLLCCLLFVLVVPSNASERVICALQNNSIVVYDITFNDPDTPFVKVLDFFAFRCGLVLQCIVVLVVLLSLLIILLLLLLLSS